MEIQFASLILSLNLSTNLLLILVIIEVVMSILTFILYKIDKERAKRKKWRIKEVTLLLFPWLMGGLGGFLGIYVLRHKNRHWYFPLNNVVALIVQASIFISIGILI